MNACLYVVLMENRRPLNEGVIRRHTAHLARLDEKGSLVLCGPFTDSPGGMVVLKAESKEEAERIAGEDPFVAEGYKGCAVRTMEWATRENGYLLGSGEA